MHPFTFFSGFAQFCVQQLLRISLISHLILTKSDSLMFRLKQLLELVLQYLLIRNLSLYTFCCFQEFVQQRLKMCLFIVYASLNGESNVCFNFLDGFNFQFSANGDSYSFKRFEEGTLKYKYSTPFSITFFLTILSIKLIFIFILVFKNGLKKTFDSK